MSQVRDSHCPPPAVIERAVCCNDSGVRPQMMVLAPIEASFRAMAAPMPRPPPVTRAIFPLSVPSIGFRLSPYLRGCRRETSNQAASNLHLNRTQGNIGSRSAKLALQGVTFV